MVLQLCRKGSLECETVNVSIVVEFRVVLEVGCVCVSFCVVP